MRGHFDNNLITIADRPVELICKKKIDHQLHLGVIVDLMGIL